MDPGKQTAVRLLRRMRLLRWTDDLRFFLRLLRSYRSNRAFTAEHDGFRVPPIRIVYDACGYTDWKTYHELGLAHANMFSRIIEAHSPDETVRICEWGCGPGRIIRHLPAVLRRDRMELYGTDYNPKSIAWCEENIRGVSFVRNGLDPPLPFPEETFDCLYAFSVLTHLSEERHFSWIEELKRVVKPGGLILLTTHGDPHRSKLLEREQRLYDRGELVVRDKIEEGKRCFVAFQAPAFMRKKLLAGLSVVEHLPGAVYQDVWVVRNGPPRDDEAGDGGAARGPKE